MRKTMLINTCGTIKYHKFLQRQLEYVDISALVKLQISSEKRESQRTANKNQMGISSYMETKTVSVSINTYTKFLPVLV